MEITRREKRIAFRRLEILAAAGRLFAERGYHRTTTKDIAIEADVSEGTIYNYFTSKEDLLMGLMEQLTERMNLGVMLSESLPEDPQDFLLLMLQNRQKYLRENGVLLQAIFSEILVNPDLALKYHEEIILPTQERIEEHLRQRIELGQIQPVNSMLLARILTGLITGLYLLQIVGDKEITAEWNELSDLLAHILFEGISVR
ncbi:MAG TPA: TetR/AcrR family transcriptional regulator [Anaerolineales bacterium]|nr:TetR/AcrR family transcriptional regulator [Anaerolineales bacterium]